MHYMSVRGRGFVKIMQMADDKEPLAYALAALLAVLLVIVVINLIYRSINWGPEQTTTQFLKKQLGRVLSGAFAGWLLYEIVARLIR